MITTELLEPRQLYSSDVNVHVAGDSCRVVGSPERDVIFVDQLKDNRIRFSSMNGFSTFNGQSELVIGAVTRWMVFDLLEGNDWLRVRHPHGTTSFSIEGNYGSDTIELRRVSSRNLIINGSAGRDSVLMIQTFNRSSFRFNGGKQEDKIRISQSTLWGESVIYDNSASSAVSIEQTDFENLGINLSPQDDRIWNLDCHAIVQPLIVSTGDGDDQYYERNFIARGITNPRQIDLGVGNNINMLI